MQPPNQHSNYNEFEIARMCVSIFASYKLDDNEAEKLGEDATEQLELGLEAVATRLREKFGEIRVEIR